MPAVSRRAFLASSAAAYAGAAEKPNDRVRIALMGCDIRGNQLLPVFAGQPNVEISHVIDPDTNMFPKTPDKAKNEAPPPKTETDVGRVLGDPSVTALVVAAPDHWHALATVWAV